MRWILIVFAALLVTACGDNAKSSDPVVAARTKYVQTAETLTRVNETISGAVRSGLIKPRSETALAIDDARGTVRAAMDVWGKDPDSVPYMNAALAALPKLIALVERATGKKLSSLEPWSTPWAPSSAYSSFSPSLPIWSHAAWA